MQQENYRNNYYGSLLDPLHGDIKLSEIEKWCISQPIFSRLRRVKQNTFLYYVFPSANHTRFEHSIGVMHLAGKIFDACKENFATGSNKLIKYRRSTDSSFYDLNKLGETEEIFYQELRLAALLHDIGHGPLSHLFDKFAISKEKFSEIVSTTESLVQHKSGFDGLLKNKESVEHEIITCAFIFELIARLKKNCCDDQEKFSLKAKKVIEGINSERIVKLVESQFEGLEDFVDQEKNVYTPFFSSIISGFPIDADRMDYLLRDSYFSGVTYGIYDTSRIFSSFLPFQENNNIFLGYKESGLDSILRFIQSRSHLFNQVYYHKTNRAANSMLAFATSEIGKNPAKLFDKKAHTTLEDLEDFYIENSDENFLNISIKSLLPAGTIGSDVLKELFNRKLFKRVYQVKIFLSEEIYKSKEDQIKQLTKKMNDKLSSLRESDIYAISDISINESFKDSKKKSISVAIKNEVGRYTFHNIWQNVSVEFERANLVSVMVRVYLRRSFQNSEQFETFKKKVNEILDREIMELENLKTE